MSDDEKKPEPELPLIEAVETDKGTYVTVHGPKCGRTQEIKHALETGEPPRPPWESTACKGPAKVNSKAYRDNYDSIFGKKLPRGEA